MLSIISLQPGRQVWADWWLAWIALAGHVLSPRVVATCCRRLSGSRAHLDSAGGRELDRSVLLASPASGRLVRRSDRAHFTADMFARGRSGRPMMLRRQQARRRSDVSRPLL